MLLCDLFMQVHTAIGNLQGTSARFHGRITVRKAVRTSGWKRPGVEPWKMKQTEVKPS